MFLTFLFMGYLRRMSNYLERIILSDLTHMTNHVTNGVETRTIDSRCYLEKEFIKLIHMNP